MSGVLTQPYGSFCYYLSGLWQKEKLKGDDPWLLFAAYAFGSEDDPSVDSELTRIGKDIVEKCDGLPLLIKELGRLLGSSRDYSEWDRTLKSLDQAKF
ncbi:hypothetical protein Tsubulata_044932 [Turnera subulata]|uniref:NB-ARC domain-containing protein n=1 Tax=Turnera subulata TaxID=218843 RepID=A0A9Q0JIS4_9ROSI|nr:hypothetical protein Tsubulata_044932 [Turnera subulata]